MKLFWYCLTNVYFLFLYESKRMIVVEQQQEDLMRDEGSQAIVRYNPSLEKLKTELDEVKNNQLNKATRLQYLSANTAFVIFLFENFPEILLPDFLESYKLVKEVEEKKLFVKYVKDSLEMSSVCPIDVKKLQADIFMTYLLSLKRCDGNFLAIPAMTAKGLH